MPRLHDQGYGVLDNLHGSRIPLPPVFPLRPRPEAPALPRLPRTGYGMSHAYSDGTGDGRLPRLPGDQGSAGARPGPAPPGHRGGCSGPGGRRRHPRCRPGCPLRRRRGRRPDAAVPGRVAAPLRLAGRAHTALDRPGVTGGHGVLSGSRPVRPLPPAAAFALGDGGDRCGHGAGGDALRGGRRAEYRRDPRAGPGRCRVDRHRDGGTEHVRGQ